MRANHIDHGIITFESKQNIGGLVEKYASIEPLLTFVSLVNVIPATNQDWSYVDVKNINDFMKKMNGRFMLEITPRYKIGNICLAVGVNIISDGKDFAYSLTEHMINRHVGRTDETHLRKFIDVLREWNVIEQSARSHLLKGSNKAVTRAHQYALGGWGRQAKENQVDGEVSTVVDDEMDDGRGEQTLGSNEFGAEVLGLDDNVEDEASSV